MLGKIRKIKSTALLPKKLIAVLEKYGERDRNLYITKINWLEDGLTLDIVINLQDNNEGLISQYWTINAINSKGNRISFESATFIELKNDDPLLWEFTGIQCQLYYSGHCANQAKLFFDLYTTHKKIFGTYIDFEIPVALQAPFKYTSGLLTQGPRNLMEEYATCLRQNGMEASIIVDSSRQAWSNQQFDPAEQNLKVLFIGNSYVIADNFLFTQNE